VKKKSTVFLKFISKCFWDKISRNLFQKLYGKNPQIFQEKSYGVFSREKSSEIFGQNMPKFFSKFILECFWEKILDICFGNFLEKKSGKNLWSFFLVHKVIEFYS
jgi:hypothetical protein